MLPFAVIGFATAVIGMLFLHFFARQADINTLTIPVAAFVGAITTAWALSLGFTAADVWASDTRARQVASEERSSIIRLAGKANPPALDSSEQMGGLKTYLKAVQETEWGRDVNTAPAPETEEALQTMRLALISLSKADVGAALMAKLVQDFDELQDARNGRLAIGSSSVNHFKWYLVIFLTILSVIVIAAVHADRIPAGRKSIVIYSVTASVSLWILAIHANPYVGATRITLGELQI
jgi:hypothetical protein